MDGRSTGSKEIESLLKRYIEIQQEEQRLKEEKASLQDALAEYMDRNQQSLWFPVVDNRKLKVRYRTTTSIKYKEDHLRERLGERYSAILTPDIRKIRRKMTAIEEALVPFLRIIGSPSPDRVRESIEKGLVRKEEFESAFEKTTRQYVSVATLEIEEPPAVVL